MKIAAVQFRSQGDVEQNLSTAKRYITEAAQEGAQLIVLPEATMQSFDSGRLDTGAQELDGPFATEIAQLAKELSVTVVAGMFRPADSVQRGDKTINRVYNTALVTDGYDTKYYDKIHTYDAFKYKESDTVKPGQEMLITEVSGIKVGVAICFDIRFPELFRDLAREGAELIVVPTSWADGPGKLEQWRLLSTARALDSTSYVLCAGQSRPGGNEKAGEPSGPTGIGHSVITDPNGVRLAEAGYEPEIIYAEVDAQEVAKTRAVLPVVDIA